MLSYYSQHELREAKFIVYSKGFSFIIKMKYYFDRALHFYINLYFIINKREPAALTFQIWALQLEVARMKIQEFLDVEITPYSTSSDKSEIQRQVI